MAKCGMKMPREEAILSPRSSGEAVVKSQGPIDFQSIPYLLPRVFFRQTLRRYHPFYAPIAIWVGAVTFQATVVEFPTGQFSRQILQRPKVANSP